VGRSQRPDPADRQDEPDRDGDQPAATVVYDRFLARLFSTGERNWVLKGGTALLARVRSARHSQDIDLFAQTGTIDAAVVEIQRAAALDLADHFHFVTGAVVTRPQRAD